MQEAAIAEPKEQILKFEAEWCNPCKMLSKVMQEVDLGVPVQKVDIDADASLAIKYSIRSVPTLVYLKDQVEVSRVSGAMQLKDLQTWIRLAKQT